jgi:hypothetical protein
MKTGIKLIILLLMIISFTSCTNKNSDSKNKEKESSIFSDKAKQKLMAEGKVITQKTLAVFQKNLKTAIKNGGIDNAINYCHKKAMYLTDSISHVTGVKIQRIAKKNRNPFNFLNQQEEKVFNEYEKEIHLKKAVQPKILVNKKGNPVYYAPIRISKDVCLKCHGTPGKDLPKKRVAKIKEYYPEDKAINFKKGDLRGLWAITFPLNRAN